MLIKNRKFFKEIVIIKKKECIYSNHKWNFMVNGELGHRPYEKLPFCFKFLKLLKKMSSDSQYGVRYG